MKKRSNPILAEYVFHFAYSLLKVMENEPEVVHEEWRMAPLAGLEDRMYCHFEHYWVEFAREGKPIPWLKIAALAMVAWVREHYSERIIRTYVDPD